MAPERSRSSSWKQQERAIVLALAGHKMTLEDEDEMDEERGE
jgi:hypothetical protein